MRGFGLIGTFLIVPPRPNEKGLERAHLGQDVFAQLVAFKFLQFLGE
jgi:hypothetical protein